MKIGLFFGSFDPPHIGHIDLVVSALNAGLVDQILVVPAWQNVWKKASSPFELRLEMCEKAFKEIPRVQICNIEGVLSEGSEEGLCTYEVLSHIKQNSEAFGLRHIKHSIITTQETWKDIPKWKNGIKLLKENEILVEGIDFHSSRIPCHSTQIRQLIKDGKLPYPFINDDLINIMTSNDLYR